MLELTACRFAALFDCLQQMREGRAEARSLDTVSLDAADQILDGNWQEPVKSLVITHVIRNPRAMQLTYMEVKE